MLLLQEGQIGEAWKSSRKLGFFVEIGDHLTDKVFTCIFLVLKLLIRSQIMKCRIQNFVNRMWGAFAFMVGQETLNMLL